MLGFAPNVGALGERKPTYELFVIMSNLFIRPNITQCNHTQVIVIAGVGFVGMINIFELTANLEALRCVQPDDVCVVPLPGLHLNCAYHGIFRNLHSRK